MKFVKINEPIRVGMKQVLHRVMMPPMAVGKALDGKINADVCEHYAKRAENPLVGLIITEHCYICRQGIAHDKQISVSQDSDIEHLRLLPERIHAIGNGTLILMQISHSGGEAWEKVTGMPVVGPSDGEGKGGIIHALTEAEILQIEDDFVKAALRAQSAGFDGIELHGAHGYLLNQFFCSLVNHRTDAYGAQTVENRSRIYVEAVSKIRAAVRPDFIVAVRFGVSDVPENGTTVADCVEACKLIEAAGADLIDISGGLGGYQRAGADAGYFKDAAKKIKQQLKIPVATTGGVKKMAEAEKLLSDGYADLIGIGRALLRNPNLAE